MSRPAPRVARRTVLGAAGTTIALYMTGCASAGPDERAGSGDPGPSAGRGSDAPRDATTGSIAAGRVPDPVRMTTWRWSQDPFALGSYSCLGPQASSADRRALAQPMSSRLLLAGEATNEAYPATVHGAWLTGRRAARQVLDAETAPTTVIVVGAGMAGLSAARSLLDAGISVVVVEGRDRVGGRVHTIEVDGSALDMGASWIEGTTGNPIQALATSLGVRTVATDFDDAASYEANGARIDRALMATAERAAERLLRQANRSDQPPGTTLAQTLQPLLDEGGYSVSERRAIELAIVGSTAYDTADDPQNLAVDAIDEGDAYDGPSVIFPGGYGQLPDAVADSIDVRLGHRVASVRDRDDGVEVVTDRDTFRGSHVIVTVPLGVLRSGAISFDPPLPARARQAIDRLNMGLLFKVCLRFDTPFWDDTDFIAYASQPAVGAWAFWMNMHKLTGEPVLMAFNGGEVGRALERLDDAALTAEAMAVLRAIYG